MTTRFLLAALAYIVPTFPLGYLWHLVIFKNYYASLLVYRPDMAFSLGVTSMAIQSVIWAYLYNRLFSGEPVLRGAVKFAGAGLPARLELPGAADRRQAPDGRRAGLSS